MEDKLKISDILNAYYDWPTIPTRVVMNPKWALALRNEAGGGKEAIVWRRFNDAELVVDANEPEWRFE